MSGLSAWQTLNADLAAVIARGRQSLVQVCADGKGIGAGCAWTDQGLIITNGHVVDERRGRGARPLSVRLAGGRELPAAVEARYPHHDLAALRVADRDLMPFVPGDSQNLRPGNWVCALGFPWGVDGGTSVGVVIGVGADLPELGDGKRNWIAASLQLRPGHSGGPLLDAQGNLIGINTLMTGPVVGAAVPVHVVHAFVRTLGGAPQPSRVPHVVMV